MLIFFGIQNKNLGLIEQNFVFDGLISEIEGHYR